VAGEARTKHNIQSGRGGEDMRRVIILGIILILFAGCSSEDTEQVREEAVEATPLIKVTAPDPIEIPASMTVSSETDWPARVNNKEIEIIQVLNIINPIAAYLVEGFKQYGDRFSPTLNEEWADTQAQLGKALPLYEDCKARRDAEKYDKKLFLDMEEVWQLLVKTGVAGVRTKAMVDDELARLTR
jgi:hypothetical protein